MKLAAQIGAKDAKKYTRNTVRFWGSSSGSGTPADPRNQTDAKRNGKTAVPHTRHVHQIAGWKDSLPRRAAALFSAARSPPPPVWRPAPPPAPASVPHTGPCAEAGQTPQAGPQDAGSRAGAATPPPCHRPKRSEPLRVRLRVGGPWLDFGGNPGHGTLCPIGVATVGVLGNAGASPRGGPQASCGVPRGNLRQAVTRHPRR